jgi:serine/threonine protein kinase
MAEPSYPEALPALTHLHWYVLERVLGQGGFGITYLAKDTNLDQRVAIKEYLPVEFATRLPDSSVRARTEELRDRYRWGLERFIQEARTLARFDHPNIVRVLSVFEFNNTAYIVMRFEEGGNLAAMLDRRGTLPEAELVPILTQVLSGLELVHNAGFIHRDIKPNNIHIGTDGRPILLDFGSARQAVGSSNTLTILIAPGYAPFEQYYNDPASQGPWTDIYGLAATAYRAICGRAPLDAVSRSKGILGSTQEIMVPASVIGAGRYSGRFLAAIDHALAFAEKDRPQTIAEWRSELVGETAALVTTPATRAFSAGQPTPPRPAAATVPASLDATVPANPPAHVAPASSRDAVQSERRTPPWAWMMMIVAIAVAAVGVYMIMESRTLRTANPQPEPPRTAPESAPAKPEEKQPAAPDGNKQGSGEQKSPQGTQPRNDAKPVSPEPEPQAKEPTTRKGPLPPKEPAPPTKKEPKKEQAPQKEPAPQPKEKQPAPPKPEPQKEAPPSASPSPPVAVPSLEPKAPAPRTATEILAEADAEFAAKHDDKAIALLRPLADAGNGRAQVRLGDAYAEGRGVERNPATARDWYEKAAMVGEINAMLRLGAMYKGVNSNLAYIWYGVAAQLNSTTAKDERDRIAPLLQPAERRQADRKVEEIVQKLKKP